MLKTKIYHFFEKFFDIRASEFKLVQLAFIYLTTLSLFYIVGSTVGTTLFLSHIGAQAIQKLLPLMYISIAITTILVTWCYDKLSARIARRKLIISTTLFFAITILLFRQVIYFTGGNSALYFTLMVWLEVCAVFIIILFFSYMGDYFNSRDARRLYGYIAIGSALGPLLGGVLVTFLVAHIAVSDLLYVCAILLILSILLAYSMSLVAIPQQQKSSEVAAQPPALKTLLANRHISLAFLIAFLGVMSYILANYQMLNIAGRTFSEVQLADFFAKFFGYVGFAQLLIELIFAGWLLRRFGVLKNLFVLPVSFLLTSVCFTIQPTLFFAVAINFTFLTLSETLDLLSRELLFLPLPTRMRIRSQALATGVLCAGGKIIGGIVLILFALIQAPIIFYNVLLVVVISIWILAIIFLVPEYKMSVAHSISDSLYSADLKNMLGELQRLFSSKEYDDVLKKILATALPEKQFFLLKLLPSVALFRLKPEIVKLTKSPNEQLVIFALQTIAGYGDEANKLLLQSFLGDSRALVQTAAIIAYSQLCLKEQGQQLVDQHLLKLLKTDRVMVAGVMGQVANIYDRWRFELNKLLVDENELVRSAAIIACRECPDVLFLPNLILNLEVNRSLRTSIRETLFTMPVTTAPEIKHLFYCSDQQEIVCSYLLRVLGNIDGPEATTVILDVLQNRRSQMLLVAACQALQKLLYARKINQKSLLIIVRCREALQDTLLVLRQAYQEMGAMPSTFRQLFGDTIYFYSAIFFILLGVQYGVRELAKVTGILFDADQTKLANNLELLEVVLPRKLFLIAVKLVTPSIVDFTFTSENISQQNIQALVNMDPWVRALTLYGLKFNTAPTILREYTMTNIDQQLFERIDTIVLLKQVELFSSIPANYLIGLAEIVHEETFNAKEYIFNEGDNGDSLYLVAHGRVSVRRGEKEIAQLGVGECIGEMAILDKLPRSASAVALEETKLLRIYATDFDEIAITHPEIALCLLKILSRRLRKMLAEV